MASDLLGDAVKDKIALHKWGRMPEYRRKLASMSLYRSLLQGSEACLIVHYGNKFTSSGKTIRILHIAVGIGDFVFAVPEFSDSVLVLIDFDLREDVLDKEAECPVEMIS